MDTVVLTKEELSEMLTTAAAKAATKVITHFQSALYPKEENIKVTKAYRLKEVAKLLNISESTVMRNYNRTDKEELRKHGKSLLIRNKKKLFLGSSVKAEYERLNGK